jgi:hypothetical protein
MNSLISQFVTAIQASAGMDASTLDSIHGAEDLLRETDQLQSLCTLCFWASLEKEERREVRGTLCLCPPTKTVLARAFATPVPVTVPNLVALLIASPCTPLAVHLSSEGLAIWGVLDSEIAGLLRLRIAGSGTLLASRSRRVLALLHRGAVSIPVAADEASLALLVSNALGKEHREARANVPAKLIRVGTTMIRHGHGGTLVLVQPEDQSWRQSVSFRFSFDAESARLLQASDCDFEAGMREAVRNHDDLVAGPKSASSFFALRERYEKVSSLHTLNQSLLSRVGDLSLIDGAVVLDLDLCLLGFGAKLLFGPEDFAVTALNAVNGKLCEHVSLAELGGTRHQSAARFVHGNRSSEVFVVSQDDRLSLFSWSERMQCVAVVQKLEHFIWEYELNSW